MVHSARPALATRTNTLHSYGLPQRKLTTFLSAPPSDKKPKRRCGPEDKQLPSAKRLRVTEPSESESETTDGEFEGADNEDAFMEDVSVAHRRARMSIPFNVLNRQTMNASIDPRKQALSTFPILKSFVSSNKSDLFKCHSVGDDTYTTPPYACSYSHNSKRGGRSQLAVATEQGTVHIIDTSKRDDWDVEPQRTTFQPHNNGIFDVKWSSDDTFLATCSGDQSVRVSDVEIGSITHVLRGHTSTVKCMAWDPTHSSLLATGGRDGSICLWDLRVSDRLQSGDSEVMVVAPVVSIYGAHEDIKSKSKPRVKKGMQNSVPRTITNLLYPDCDPYGLVSSGSFDGILRYWDLRQPVTPRKGNTVKAFLPTELYSSPLDPTMLRSRRPRGIISLASGTGPSTGLIFAIGADSQIHTYDLPTLTPLRTTLQHKKLQTNSFYVGLSVSPCGRWLACGGSGTHGNSFLFDVENAYRPFGLQMSKGVELMGRIGEVGAVDWAQDMLATCTDDGTVRIWRPDVTRHRWCQSRPEESWNWSWAI